MVKKRKPQPYYRVRVWCPDCDAVDIETTRTNGRHRYHRCNECGLSFQSFERDPRERDLREPVVLPAPPIERTPDTRPRPPSKPATPPTSPLIPRGGLKKW